MLRVSDIGSKRMLYILREIRAFVGGAGLHDDLTLVLLKVNPTR